MSVLVVTPQTIAAANKVVAYAEAHRMDIKALINILLTDVPVGNDPERVLIVPRDYRCVFSIEEQPMLGWCRHLSVSVFTNPNPRARAHPAAIDSLLGLFGFRHGLAGCIIFDEPECSAINVVEPIDPKVKYEPTIQAHD